MNQVRKETDAPDINNIGQQINDLLNMNFENMFKRDQEHEEEEEVQQTSSKVINPSNS